MNILIDIGHPAHVHLFKNLYKILTYHNHTVYITLKHLPQAEKLLQLYNIPYIRFNIKFENLVLKGLCQILYFLQMLLLVWKKHVDIGINGMTVAQVSHFSKMKSIIIDDDDDDAEKLFSLFAHPLADCILTPNSIHRKAKQTIYYNGTHELAYLHPNYFHPNQAIIQKLNILPTDVFFILRFNAFKAYHDKNMHGLSLKQKRKLIQLLSPMGKIFITTEKKIEAEFFPYQINVPPHEIHSLMYYATLFISDSQTMTSEAAILGTPAIKLNSFAGKLSVPNELEHKYNLCFAFPLNDEEGFFNKIIELLHTKNVKDIWKQRRKKFLQDKIDVTAFFADFIENF